MSRRVGLRRLTIVATALYGLVAMGQSASFAGKAQQDLFNTLYAPELHQPMAVQDEHMRLAAQQGHKAVWLALALWAIGYGLLWAAFFVSRWVLRGFKTPT